MVRKASGGEAVSASRSCLISSRRPALSDALRSRDPERSAILYFGATDQTLDRKTVADTTCGRCGTFSHMTTFGGGSQQLLGGAGSDWRVESAFKCDACGRLSVGSRKIGSGIQNFASAEVNKGYWERTNGPIEWAPTLVRGQSFPDVPSHVATPASEAHKCRSIGALMSAILMARAVIESVAKDNGITSGSLFVKIDAMHTAGLIDLFAKDTAHTIRVFGNDMAHGDFTVAVDADDADGVLTFMDYILHGVYQSKAQLQRLKDAAAARAAAQTANP